MTRFEISFLKQLLLQLLCDHGPEGCIVPCSNRFRVFLFHLALALALALGCSQNV